MTTAIQQIPFLYSYTGGKPPETLEVFWLHPDGVAEYVTGNSWPQQPPFDEVGHYRAVLAAEDCDALNRLAVAAQCEATETLRRPPDSGLEFFRANCGKKNIEAEWVSSSVPARYQALARHIRQCIFRTRQTPWSTLRVAIGHWQGGETIGLTMQNRGRDPFVFYGLEPADETLRLRVRVRTVSVDGGRQPAPPNPLLLAHLKPVALSNSTDWEPDADGKILLGSGKTLRIEIHPDALRSFAAGILECLVQISFWRGTPEGGSLLETGWAMPAPIRFDPASEAQSPAFTKS